MDQDAKSADTELLRHHLDQWERRFQQPVNIDAQALAAEKLRFALAYGYAELKIIYHEVLMVIFRESEDGGVRPAAPPKAAARLAEKRPVIAEDNVLS